MDENEYVQKIPCPKLAVNSNPLLYYFLCMSSPTYLSSLSKFLSNPNNKLIIEVQQNLMHFILNNLNQI